MRITQRYTISKGNVSCITSISPNGISGVQTRDEEKTMLADMNIRVNLPSEFSNYVKLDENGTPIITNSEDEDGELITVQCIEQSVLLKEGLSIIYSFKPDHDHIIVDEIFDSPTLMAQAYLTIIGEKVRENVTAAIKEMRKQYNIFSSTKIYDDI